jgi:sec-independent protein translocase protein TatA
MGIAGLGLPELLIIFGVVVLLFGARKLPQLGGAIGESIKNFKKGVKEDQKELDASKDDNNTGDSGKKA